jgi:hypothetical protein
MIRVPNKYNIGINNYSEESTIFGTTNIERKYQIRSTSVPDDGR